MARAIGYKEALRWLLANDDCVYLEEPGTGLSVAASLVADIYGMADETVRRDLEKLSEKEGLGINRLLTTPT